MGEKFIVFNGEKKIGVVHEDGYERDPNHQYLKWDKAGLTGFISEAAAILSEQFLGKKQSIKKWREDTNLYQFTWEEPITKKTITTKKINYKIISEHLRVNNSFDEKIFDLPTIWSGWLDRSIDISINYHYVDKNGEVLQVSDGTISQEYGEAFPLKPMLDREGHIFTTFLPQLTRRIIKQRKQLVENSHLALMHDWVFELRNVINDSISLIDITLNQLYSKAEFSPEVGWTFDKSKLGLKNNRRIKDKLKWVRDISGNELNIEAEFSKFENLRVVRNHLNHFDPPTLVITLEEAADWLNDVLYIGKILIKIRQALNTPVSLSLIELVSQRKILFNPESGFTNRSQLDSSKFGYRSSTWQMQEEGN